MSSLDPLRIVTVPGVTLDVVVRRQLNGSSELELELQAAASDDLTHNSSDAKEPELFSTSDDQYSCDPPRIFDNHQPRFHRDREEGKAWRHGCSGRSRRDIQEWSWS